MSDEQIALARRAVACRGWERMSGMLYADGAWRFRVGEGWHAPAGVELLPVLDDPATLGCLLALVRAAWGIPSLSLSPWQGGWDFAWAGHGAVGPCGYWLTEAEALVAALEASPTE